MELTKRQSKNLKEFIQGRKSDIEFDMENFGLLKCFIEDKRFKWI